MYHALFALDVCVKRTGQTLFKLRPPHMWRLFSCIKEASDHFVRLANVDGMNTNTFIVFDETFERFSSIIGACQALDLCFGSVISGDEVHEESMHLD